MELQISQYSHRWKGCGGWVKMKRRVHRCTRKSDGASRPNRDAMERSTKDLSSKLFGSTMVCHVLCACSKSVFYCIISTTCSSFWKKNWAGMADKFSFDLRWIKKNTPFFGVMRDWTYGRNGTVVYTALRREWNLCHDRMVSTRPGGWTCKWSGHTMYTNHSLMFGVALVRDDYRRKESLPLMWTTHWWNVPISSMDWRKGIE